MKILYISNVFPKKNSTIYTDLAEELKKAGHDIIVVASDGDLECKSILQKEREIDVLRVKTLPMYNVGLIKKGLSIITLKGFMKKEIKKHLKGMKFDFILFETPPITVIDIVEWASKYFNCKSYLMLKDIFPQNAVDLGMMKKEGLFYKFFKNKEKKLYKIPTVIGCMSQKNKNYILKENNFLNADKIEIFPNTKRISKLDKKIKNKEILKKYEIPINKIIAIYGGNMGKPQGLSYFLEIINSNKDNSEIFFLLVGRGTERSKIKEYLVKNNIKNAKLLEELPRKEYDILVNSSDIGLIFLNECFTIPNFPSRILSYFESAIPVIAAIDNNTDFGEMIEEAKAGYKVEAGNIEDFNVKLNKLIEDKKNMKQMGINGRKFLEKNYDVKGSVKLLEKFYKNIIEKINGDGFNV